MPQAMGRMRRSKLSTSEASDDEGTALRSLEENSSGEQAQQLGGAKAWLSRAAERVKQAAGLASSSSSPNSGTLLAFYRQHSEQFKALLPYLWPSGKPGLRARLVCALAFLVLSKVASTGSPIATKYTIDSLTSNNWNTATLGVIIYGSLRFFSNLASEVRDNLFQPLSAYASRRISLLVYDHVQSLSLRFHINRRTGALLNAVNRGSTAYSELLQRLAFSIFPIILEVTLASAYLFSAYTYAFGAITLGLVVGYFGFTFVATEWRNKFRRLVTSANDDFNQKASDSLVNFETIKYFSAERFMSQEYDRALEKFQNAQIQNQQSLLALNTGQSLIIGACIIGALYLSVERIRDGKMSIGDFALVQGYIIQIFQPLGFLGTVYRIIKTQLVDVEQMFSLLKEPRDVQDREDSEELDVNKCEDASVEFDNVSFSYDSQCKRRLALSNVSFRVPSGGSLAIVGKTGAGKSSVTRLLFRLYDLSDDPSCGSVRVCGRDVRSIKQSSLRAAIGIVPQDCVLFNDTLAYNIAFGAAGRLGATESDMASRDEIWRAAEAAQLTEFINQQPKGLDTVVGERGLRLSGGEKQRVAIARCLLKNPLILVYDEATSSLDSKTEKSIKSALDDSAAGRTSITIAHRLSTIMNVDKVIVLDEGRVAEQGPPAELLRTEGSKFKEMWEEQQRVAKEAAEQGHVSKEASETNLEHDIC